MMPLAVRRARDSELPACRMLLPGTAAHPARDYLLALATEPPRVVGAAAFTHLPGVVEGLRVAVVPTARRCGVGTRLIECAVVEAQTRGATSVSGWIERGDTADADRFAESRGFQRADKLTAYECDVRPFQEYHWRLRRALQNRRHIPAEATAVPLAEADRDAVSRLWKSHMSAYPGLPLAAIGQQMASGQYGISLALVVGHRIAGIMVARAAGDRCILDAKVIAPEYRRGWAGAFLGAALGDLTEQLRLRWLEFAWTANAPDTGRLAERFPGRVLSIRNRYELHL